MMKNKGVIFIVTAMGLIAPIVFSSAKETAVEENKPAIALTIGPAKEMVAENEFALWASVKPELYLNSPWKSEIENTGYCPFEIYSCDYLVTRRNRLFTSKKEIFSVDKEKIKAYLESLSQRINKDPVDAKFKIEDGKVAAFSLSKDGIRLDVEKSLAIISDSLMKNYATKNSVLPDLALAYDKLEPQIKSNEVENLGINTLLGEGKSNFRGSPKNRIFNINVAVSHFNGALIKPGQEFSFVELLGEVDGEHGYKEELVIKKDKTEPEFGGGICQVSTTTFRAAIYSGLKITARTPHAYPVSYYNPQGLDATVYVPRPDLRFINNTPGYILIQTKIEGTELTFQFYGTDDGRLTEIIGPKVIERNSDGSMKTTFTQIVKDKSGKTIIEDVFKSAYESPSKYPHPGEEIFTHKPDDWSRKQWDTYKSLHNL